MIEILKTSLANSCSTDRKAWARQIVDDDVPLRNLLPLLHRGDGTAQRFMWLMGDVCELEPDRVAPYMNVLFELRNQMPFPGMQRSVAKWLLLTNVPEGIEEPAIQQLLDWLKDDGACIASKSFSARALVDLVSQRRVDRVVLVRELKKQSEHVNRAYAGRMIKLLERIR